MGQPSSAESVATLIDQTRSDGIHLWVEGSRLRFRAPSGALPEALKRALAERRSDIIAHLRAESASHIVEGPLAENQHGLWFLHQLAAESSAYHVAFVAGVHGPLNLDIFEEAVQVVVDRHESLRTTYLAGEQGPLRRVHGYRPFRLERIDAGGWSDEQMRQRLAADYARPFDLNAGPVIRVGLYRESAERHVLMIVAHHIAVDGTSMFVLLDELTTVHDALAAGTPIPPRGDGATFDEFVQWQAGAVANAGDDRAYWTEVLTPPPPALDLPTTWPRRRTSSMRGGTVWQRIEPELAAAIRQFARHEGVTDYVILLSLWFTLLHRLTGRTDISVGAPVQGRPAGRFARTVGDFVNTLPLRLRDIDGRTFPEVVREVHRTVLEGFRHQDFPLSRMVQAVGGRPDGAGPPFQTLFVLQDFGRFESIQRVMLGAEQDRIAFGSMILSPLRIDQQEGQFELSLDVWPSQEGFDCGWRFDSDLFDRQVIEGWAGAFEALAAGIVADPGARVADLPLLRARDRTARAGWNATQRSYPADATVHRLVEARVARHPDATAVVAADGTYSYADLLDRSRSIAAALRGRGVRPGDRVAVLVPRGRDMVAALLGVIGTGASYVPLDPSYPVARIEYMLRDSGAVVLVIGRGVEVATDDLLPVVDLDADAMPDPAPFTVVDPESAAYVIYTSGSTGNPKGVVVSHRALVNFLLSMSSEPGLAAGDALLAVTTISFDIAGLELFLPLLVGARIVIAEENDIIDGRRLARRMDEDAITVLQATPATWKLLLEAGWTGKADLRALCGGEALPESLANALLERVGELWNLYGPTETTVWSTIQRIRKGEPILVGHPIANTDIHVLDPRMHPVPIGVPGELWIGGAGLSDGYLGRPELTAERFRDDPAAPGSLIYGTGDLVRFHPDGRLQHLGRLDHQVKVRGYRIELGEIESRLRAGPGVADAVVVARGDHLVAYVTSSDEQPTSSTLRRWLADALPEYMIPSHFVPLEALPLTANGKVDRRALPNPAGTGAAERAFHTPPISPTEIALAGIWSSVLGVADPGLEDSFFELGGHSLLAARVAGEAEERFGIELPLVAIFNQPTLGELAAEIDRLRLGLSDAGATLPAGFEAYSF